MRRDPRHILQAAAEAFSVVFLLAMMFEVFAPKTFLRPDRGVDYSTTATVRRAGVR